MEASKPEEEKQSGGVNADVVCLCNQLALLFEMYFFKEKKANSRPENKVGEGTLPVPIPKKNIH